MQVTRWALFKISREAVNFIQVHGIKNDSDLLLKILPFGSALGATAKCVLIDDSFYLTYLKMNGQEGKGLVFAFNSEDIIKTDLLGFLPEMPKLLENPPVESIISLTPQKPQLKPIKIKDLDVAIFSFLCDFPTIILGEREPIAEIIASFYYSIPNEMKEKFFFVNQSTSLTENVNIIGMPFSEDVLSELENSKGKHTIMIVDDRVYGNYSSALCKKIANYLEKGSYQSIKDLLNDFHQIIKESSELPPVLEFSGKYSLHLSDAQLALIMRAQHFGKPIPNNLVEDVN